MKAVELQNVTKIFNVKRDKRTNVYESIVRTSNKNPSQKIVALDNISFSTEAGEMIGIIGHNGSGKTTLLRIIAGISKPTTGNVIVNGRMVPFLQLGSGFQTELNAIENIKLQGLILGSDNKTIQGRIKEILEYAELEEFANMPIKHYSAGMFARLAFAVAIQVDPDILVLDEVLAVGDLAFQKKSYDTFLSLRNNGKTIIYVTHNLIELEKLCDKAVLLDKGKLVAFGMPKDIASRYKEIVEDSIKRENSGIVNKISEYYREVLNREPDQSGLSSLLTDVKAGKIILDDIPHILRKSEEYLNKKSQN
jgi:ABC-type polysaccharide/polyol phosphate transport system ATPase subunit